jgi:RHS repeat-associated protein
VLIESYSIVPSAFYQIEVFVQEAKFEISTVYPSVIAQDQSATLRLDGTLFGINMLAFLTNLTVQIPATYFYRYTSEVAYATFNSVMIPAGNYSVTLYDEDMNRYCSLTNAVTVSSVAPMGKLVVDLVAPDFLRAGTTTVIQVKVANSGFSDVEAKFLLITTSGNTKLLSTDADDGALPSPSIAFIPVARDQPNTVLSARSIVQFAFRLIPDSVIFSGNEPIRVALLEDVGILQTVQSFIDYYRPLGLPHGVWKLTTNNIYRCLGNNPTNILSTLNGYLVQHYSAFYTLIDLIGHLGQIVDGAYLPLLAQSVDLYDRIYAGPIQLSLERSYSSQISVRKTSGPFGKGWTSPVLELKLYQNGSDLLLVKQRRQYLFKMKSNVDTDYFVNPGLPEDHIAFHQTNIAYTSGNVVYMFDLQTYELVAYQDIYGIDGVNLTYGSNNMVLSLNHSNGNAILFAYSGHGLVVNARLIQAEQVVSEVFYAYNGDGLLIRVSDGSDFIVYDYTSDGDLTSSRDNSPLRTTFTYDDFYLVNGTSTFLHEKPLLQVLSQLRCDGRLEMTVHPLNVTSTFVFGFGGRIIENKPHTGPSTSYVHDRVQMTSFVFLDSDYLTVSQRFDSRTKSYIASDANDHRMNYKLNDVGQISQIGYGDGPYYNFTYDDLLVTRIDYRDGTNMTFTYTGKRQLETLTLRDGSSVVYSYNSNKKIASKQTASGRFSYTYATNGLQSTVTSPDGSVTRITFNNDELPVSVEYPDGTRLDYSYNECNRRRAVTSNNGYNCTYIYDDRCRLVALLDGNGTTVAEFMYSNDDKLIRKQLGNGMFTIYTYESDSLRLRQLRNYSPNGTVLSSYVYTYDKFGYRIKTVSHDGIWTYRYDVSGQLIEWVSPYSDGWQKIEYDGSFNRKSKETTNGKDNYQTNAMYQYTSFGNTQNFTFDKNGNAIQKTKLIQKKVVRQQYVYNQEGYVIKTINDQITCDYIYSIFGSVTSRTCSDGTSVSYVVDPFASFGPSVLIEDSAVDRRFVYYGQQQGLVAAANGEADIIYFLFDGDGSTVQTGDRLGLTTNNYVYDPFGLVINGSGVSDNNPFKYLAQYGLRVVNETDNVVWIRHRLYDAEHGRFLSADPTGVFGSPTNPYAYANNNPLTYKDINGLFLQALVVSVAIPAVVRGGFAAYDYLRDTPSDQFSWRRLGAETAKGAVGAAVSTGIALAASPWLGLYSLPVAAVVGTHLGYMTCNGISGGQCKPPTAADYIESGFYSYLGRLLQPLRNRIKPISEALASFMISFLTSLFREPHPVVRLLNCKSCKELLEQILRYLRSMDPNDILGPAGYGDNHFVGLGDVLEYKIEFENEPNATAPAQLVRIECKLDPGLDAATIRLGTFAFGDFSTNVVFTSNRFSETVDVRATTGTYVLLQAVPDALGLKMIWVFQALDETGQQPTNVTKGFLPPNNGTTGQGYVTFRINIKDEIADSTKIFANATIWFDENPPISTRTIFNTVDTSPPGTVAINTTLVPGGILLQFSCDETGSGVRSFDLFDISDSSLPPSTIKTDINSSTILVNFVNSDNSDVSAASDSQNIIYLNLNQTYSLIAVAIDNVGHRGPLDLESAVNISYWSVTSAASISTCPSLCSGKGLCTVDGCKCNYGFTGLSCNQTVIVACEPPMLELFVVSNFSRTTANVSNAVIFVTANPPSSAGNVSIYIRLFIIPNVTSLSKGQWQNNGSWVLAEDNFGEVTLTIPSQFVGYVNLTVSAVLNSLCGSSMRSQDISMYANQISSNISYVSSVLSTSAPRQYSLYGVTLTNVPATILEGFDNFNSSSKSVALVTNTNAPDIVSVSSTSSIANNSLTQLQTAATSKVPTVTEPSYFVTGISSVAPNASLQVMSTVTTANTAFEARTYPSDSIAQTVSVNSGISFETPLPITSEATAVATDKRIEISTSTEVGGSEKDVMSTYSINSNASTLTQPLRLYTDASFPHTPTETNETKTETVLSKTSVSTNPPTTSVSSQWSEWSEWSTCTRTCDTGVQQRWRRCLLGDICSGENVDVATCQLAKCPGTPHSNEFRFRQLVQSSFCVSSVSADFLIAREEQ